MSSFVEPSSIVLIIGAICIFLFIMHGLWFSNKPQNRKLKQNNQHDMELSKSNTVGKVRIVTNDPVGSDEPKTTKPVSIKPRASTQKQVRLNDGFGDEYSELQASVSVNPKVKRQNLGDTSNAVSTGQSTGLGSSSPLGPSGQVEAKVRLQTATPNEMATLQSNQAMGSKVQANVRIEPSSDNLGVNQNTLSAKSSQHPWLDNYEIVIVASPDRPFLGEDIEALCNEYGFLPGYVEDKLKIYSVYENNQDKSNEVFRICSMERPFCFPEDMRGFKTSAIALYMPLPPKGKGKAYFNALRMATEIFLNQLGGQMQDNSHQIISLDRLDDLAAGLEEYDLSQSD